MATPPATSTHERRIVAVVSAVLTAAIAAWCMFFVAYITWNMPEQVHATNTGTRIAYIVLFAVAPSLTAWRWVRTPAGRRWAQNWPLLAVAALTIIAYTLACYDDFTARNTPSPLFGALFYTGLALCGPLTIAVHLSTYTTRRDG
ncbi:hypothetical protein ACFOW4_10490 [Micromonospora sp. GCM10011542]|uniref:hypothetical protein n=1 Tax=Micromonospora sp. GCM10011542 TaxID=3317337 RepID=UPI003609385C